MAMAALLEFERCCNALAIGEFERRWRVERISRGKRGWFMQEPGEHIRRAQYVHGITLAFAK
jgi:hypothetical protein